MLEQWRADQLLRVPKVYETSLRVTLTPGADVDYQVVSDEGDEHFLLDVRTSARNRRKARFQLRYRRELVLARLCTSAPHGNPDGVRIAWPHLHRYREGYGDKWAEQLGEFIDIASALEHFCKVINLPAPEIRGGLT